MHFTILETILSVFFTALLVSVVFRQLHLPVILGYLLVGALVGPKAFALVPDSAYLNELSEFGIVLLMFTIGLEFSLPKLFALRYAVFVIGGLQVTITILVVTFASQGLGIAPLPAIVIGCIATMSSTAIVLKQLQDQLELYTPHGLNAVGVLLFQDLAVIPFIILIPSLAMGTDQSLTHILLWAFLKGIVAILLIFTVGRWLLRPLFHLIAKTRAVELFTLTVLMVTLTSAWLTHTLGLSFALGAFLAGIMLAETEFRHQIEVEIRPFRDILLGLFFITIGMLTDITSWHKTWHWILLMLSALTVGKMMIVTIISRLSGNDGVTAIRTGIVLAEGSEFGFALLTIALMNGVLPPDYGQVILAALLISIALSPIFIHFNKTITNVLLPKITRAKEKKLKLARSAKKHKHHVIICGYGRVGQHITRLLGKVNFPYVAIDLDSQLVKNASLAGDDVMYGDPTHPEILKAAGIDHARVIVISFNDLRATTKILAMVKHSYPQLPTLVRCRDESELKQLKEFGATQVIAELFEESLTLSHHLLNLLDIPTEKVVELIQNVRREDYDLLQRVFSSTHEDAEIIRAELQEQLMPIVIPEGAYAINHKISDFNFAKVGVEIVGIRRGQEKYLKTQHNLTLLPNDIIIMFGKASNLEKAERIILQGN
jgi:monovalent cation:H+ antiporter-2, CPA2 family